MTEKQIQVEIEKAKEIIPYATAQFLHMINWSKGNRWGSNRLLDLKVDPLNRCLTSLIDSHSWGGSGGIGMSTRLGLLIESGSAEDTQVSDRFAFLTYRDRYDPKKDNSQNYYDQIIKSVFSPDSIKATIGNSHTERQETISFYPLERKESLKKF